MSIEIPTQPIPSDVAEACALLSAAERHPGVGPPGLRWRQRLAAGDVLDILLDVAPRYSPIDTSRSPMPLPDVAPVVVRALEHTIDVDGSAQDKLRAARALRRVRQAVP